jgi:hypothetical protein
MDCSRIARCLTSRLASRLAACGLGIALFVFVAPGPSFANDNCQRLEALSQQYAGVELTTDQQRLKARLVVWYNRNCHDRRQAAAAN